MGLKSVQGLAKVNAKRFESPDAKIWFFSRKMEQNCMIDMSFDPMLHWHDINNLLTIRNNRDNRGRKGIAMLVERIIYGFYLCNLGEMVIAHTDKGICRLGFVLEGQKQNDILAQLKKKFPDSSLLQSNTVADNLGRRALRAWEDGREASLEVDFRGTDFQIEVWNALREIGRGYVCAYSEIAEMINRPEAVRAVGLALAENPVSIIVPCHRVIQKSGRLGNYTWGADMKRRLLQKEGVPMGSFS